MALETWNVKTINMGNLNTAKDKMNWLQTDIVSIS